MELTIKAEPRKVLKKKVKQLRNQGLVPASIYGFNGNHAVQLVEKEFAKIFEQAGRTSVVTLEVDAKKHNVLIDEVQVNPLTRIVTHATLREVNMKEEITAEIPFALEGEEVSPAVKEESSLVILSIPTVELRGLPSDLPHAITINVSKIHAGETIALKDIKLPKGVTVVREEELEMTIVTTTSAVQTEVELNVNEAIAESNAAAEAKAEDKEAK